MPRKSEEIRNREQRARQQKLRDAARLARRPDRDDVARTALFIMISSMTTRGATEVLDDLRNRVVKMLAEQGFDERLSDLVFEELVAKYRAGDWPFRRKVHLLHPDDPDQDG